MPPEALLLLGRSRRFDGAGNLKAARKICSFASLFSLDTCGVEIGSAREAIMMNRITCSRNFFAPSSSFSSRSSSS